VGASARHAVPDHVDIHAQADEFYHEMLAKHQRNPPREDFQLNSEIINMALGSTGAGREMRSDVAL
jgi:hypothetical protein